MPSNSKAIFFSVVLLHLLFLVAVARATLAGEQHQEKLGKSAKKAIDWQQSGKKRANKEEEFPSYDATTERGRIDPVEASGSELRTELIIGKDQHLNSSGADEKKREESAPGRAVNRLRRRRNVGWTISPSAEVSNVGSSGQTSNRATKNYKKLKHAESVAQLEAAATRKNAFKKKSLESAAYPTTYRAESNNSGRLKRELFAESSKVGPRLRANASDYYAQRKAIMERFYARQRQLTERLEHQSTSTPRNLLWSELKLNFGDENNRTTTTAPANYLPRQDTLNTNLLDSDANTRPTTATIAPVQNRRPNHIFDNYEPDFDNRLTRTSNNVERDAPADSPPNCDNIPRSGRFSSKRNSTATSKDCTEGVRGDMAARDESATKDSGTANRQWGTCTGKVVYQHNLLLGLKGPSNLDTRFEVAIQGPICITCVDIARYNDTRANVTLEGGGRGHQFITLRLKGFENEGFSYIVKVYGVRKTTNECEK